MNLNHTGQFSPHVFFADDYMEKVVDLHIKPIALQTRTLQAYQFAYQVGKSTVTNLYSLTASITL